MRITAAEKAANRGRILTAAREQLVARGFEAASMRAIASEAGLAVGTLFNYFPSKEDLAMEILAEALQRAREAWRTDRREGASLEEELFGHVATGLRELRPFRSFVGPVLETALSPFRRAGSGDEERVRHLEVVAELLAGRDRADAAGPVAMHLYWTLYLGVLGWWSTDDSPNQETTLGVLDHAVGLFVASLPPAAEPAP